MILLATFVAFNLQMRYEAGVLAVGFGRLPEMNTMPAAPAIDAEALKSGMSQILEARLRLEREEWIQMLKIEWAKFSTALDLRQQSLLQSSFIDLETRVNNRILNTQAALQTGNAEGLDRLYQIMRTERQQEMVFVSDRLDQIARNTEARNNQTDAILSTLLEVAELGIRNN
jgi:hypothetical protein